MSPLKKGKGSFKQNIREFHKGKIYARTKKRYGKRKANKQAVAVAYAQRRRSKK